MSSSDPLNLTQVEMVRTDTSDAIGTNTNF